MRLAEVPRLFGSAEPHEQIKHFAVQGTLRLRKQLSVRKGPRASFSELYIALRVQLARRAESFHILYAFLDGLAALDHNGLDSVIQQPQRRKEPTGSRTYDVHARRGFFDFFKDAGRRRKRLIRALHRIHPTNIVFIARVERFF